METNNTILLTKAVTKTMEIKIYIVTFCVRSGVRKRYDALNYRSPLITKPTVTVLYTIDSFSTNIT